MLLATLLLACSSPPAEAPLEMEELVWLLLRDFGTEAGVAEAELLAAWVDAEMESPDEGYTVQPPSAEHVSGLSFSPNLELAEMAGAVVIRRVRGTLDQYAAVVPEPDQSFAHSSYTRWERSLQNGSEATWADHDSLLADDSIEKNIGLSILLPYPMLREYGWFELERGPVVLSHSVIHEEGWADESNGIVGGFTLELLLPAGEDMIWLNCTWTQVESLLGDNPAFYTEQIIKGSTDVMIGTELYVAGPA